MTCKLPSTPAETLDISTPERLAEIEAGVQAALQSGEWLHPYSEAATDLREMTFTDIIYWVYKSAHPITKMEKDTEGLLQTQNTVGLPKGFKTQNIMTIGAAGDLLQAPGLENSKDILFENISNLLFDQDLSFANFESPIVPTDKLVAEVIGDKAAPLECSSREQFDTLTSYKGKRFTVLNTSNNHMIDMGLEGIENTLNAFAEENILNVGTNRTKEEYGQGKIIIINNIKIGFASATFGLNGHEVPEGEEYRIHTANLLARDADSDLTLIKQQIDDCKEQGCDFIITSIHWGYEFELFPRKKQIEAARELAEYGADTIISHHPHVIQPIEYYTTKRDPNRVVPISYSLGSLTWGFTAPHIVLGLIQNLQLAKGLFEGKHVTYIEKASVTPVFRSVIEEKGETVTRMEKLADHIDGKNNRHPAEYIAQIKHYADLTLGV